LWNATCKARCVIQTSQPYDCLIAAFVQRKLDPVRLLPFASPKVCCCPVRLLSCQH
jgi:hypothetical protein